MKNTRITRILKIFVSMSIPGGGRLTFRVFLLKKEAKMKRRMIPTKKRMKANLEAKQAMLKVPIIGPNSLVQTTIRVE
jgi:hypothetical protein